MSNRKEHHQFYPRILINTDDEQTLIVNFRYKQSTTNVVGTPMLQWYRIEDLQGNPMAADVLSLQQRTASNNDDRDALAISGYFPLYLDQQTANEAGTGDSHSHVLDGRTYYMPDGVVQYHGTYQLNSNESESY